MKNRLVAVRGIVVDVIQIGLRLIFILAWLWAFLMIVSAVWGQASASDVLFFWLLPAFLLFTGAAACRGTMMEIRWRFKEKIGWLQVLKKHDWMDRTNEYSKGSPASFALRWVMLLVVISLGIVTGKVNGDNSLPLTSSRLGSTEAVYLLGSNVTYFNPGQPEKWEDAGRIVISSYSRIISDNISGHGTAAAWVQLVAKPFSTELVRRYKIPLDPSASLHALLKSNYHLGKQYWLPGQATAESVQCAQVANDFDKAIVDLADQQDAQLNQSIEDCFKSYVAHTPHQLTVKGLRIQIIDQLGRQGWQVRSIDVTGKTNNWH